METKKAKFLNKYLLTCIQAFKDVSAQVPIEDYEIDGKLVNFKGSDFENHYNAFLKELEIVLLETMNFTTTHDYIVTCLFDIITWKGFHPDQDKMIFTVGYEEDFLIKLKQNIEKYTELIIGFLDTDMSGNPSGFIGFFESRINSKFMLNPVKPELTFNLIKENKPVTFMSNADDCTINSLPYQWNASDTDLLELSTALIRANAITRKDRKKMTHKEMNEVFEKLFDHKIKDAKGKLATAVIRKKSVTPFLDSLVDAFEAYSRERDEK